jgi:hypothetical protein
MFEQKASQLLIVLFATMTCDIRNGWLVISYSLAFIRHSMRFRSMLPLVELRQQFRNLGTLGRIHLAIKVICVIRRTIKHTSRWVHWED